MYLGHIVEIATPEVLYENPIYPYTRTLLSAVPLPDPDLEAERERIQLTGELPSPLNPPSGRTFNTRCPIAIDKCPEIVPELRNVAPGHSVACIRAVNYGSY